MDIKHKNTWYSNLRITFTSRYIPHQHWYTLPELYKFVEISSIEIFWLLSQPLTHLRFNSSSWKKRLPPWRQFLDPVVNRFIRQTLPTINRKHFFKNILWNESIAPPKITHNRMLFFGNTFLKHGRHFDYWNQPLTTSTRVCYQNSHEAGLCCYLVIYIENILRPLQLIYFHLWPIYWISIVVSEVNY
jgi:hypothetical protein